MQKWQYETTIYDPDDDDAESPLDLDEHMDEMGAAGWELVGTPIFHDGMAPNYYELFWKRPV